MNERERRFDAWIAEIGKELAELCGGEHALVDERATRQRREVHTAFCNGSELDFGTLTRQVHPTVESEAIETRSDDKRLKEQRFDALGHRTDH